MNHTGVWIEIVRLRERLDDQAARIHLQEQELIALRRLATTQEELIEILQRRIDYVACVADA